MPGPDPAKARRRRNVPEKLKNLTVLDPNGRDGEVPDVRLPVSSDAAREMWDAWWRSPQATRWHEPTAVWPLSRLAQLYDKLLCGDDLSTAENTRMGQLEDRFGLTAKGMKDLNWVIGSSDVEDGPTLGSVASMDDKRRERLLAAAGS